MIVFLSSMDNKTGKVVIHGCTPLKIKVSDDSETVKLEKDWDLVKDETTLINTRALNALYNGVDKNISGSLTLTPVLKMHENLLKWPMKEFPKFRCQDFNSLLPNLKT